MITYIGQDSSAVKRVTHRACGAVLEYHDVDVVPLHRGKDWTGGADGSDGFRCPKCGGNVIIRSW